ncbi:MAG: single-stranded DNA-binding protein [bacterium]|nr:single-stranded DNA-binding protein [bacterium]
MNLNRVILLGRLTRDPEVRTTPKSQTVCSFGIATNRVYTDAQNQKQERVEYHNIVAWGKLGEICGKYLTRGQLTLIEGRIETRSWDTPEGEKRQKTEIIAENMQMGPRTGGGPGGAPAPDLKTPSNANDLPTISMDEPTSPAPKTESGTNEINIEEIPF